VKAFQILLSHAGASLRTARARAGLTTLPAALHLRLDDLDAPPGTRAPPEPRTHEDWQRDIAAWVRHAGPGPMHLVARATHPDLAEVARFAHRLDCVVHVRTSARGMDAELAAALLQASPASVRVRVAGTDDTVQGEVLGEAVSDATAAVEHLLTLRALLFGSARRGLPRIGVAWVPTEAGAPHLRGIFDLARRAALDGVLVEAPWTPSPAGPALRRALEWARLQHPPFHETPRATLDAMLAVRNDVPETGPRRMGTTRCDAGGTRLEVRADGRFTHCPVGCDTPVGSAHPGAAAAARTERGLAGGLDDLEAQRAAIRVCSRACAHPDVKTVG
jgi:hypothetical protein